MVVNLQLRLLLTGSMLYGSGVNPYIYSLISESQRGCAPLGPCLSSERSRSQDCGSFNSEEPNTKGSVALLIGLTAEIHWDISAWHFTITTKNTQNHLNVSVWKQLSFSNLWSQQLQVKQAAMIWMAVHVAPGIIQWAEFVQWIFFSYVNNTQQHPRQDQQWSAHKTRPFPYNHFVSSPKTKRNATKCFCCDCLSTAEAIRHPAGR